MIQKVKSLKRLTNSGPSPTREPLTIQLSVSWRICCQLLPSFQVLLILSLFLPTLYCCSIFLLLLYFHPLNFGILCLHFDLLRILMKILTPSSSLHSALKYISSLNDVMECVHPPHHNSHVEVLYPRVVVFEVKEKIFEVKWSHKDGLSNRISVLLTREGSKLSLHTDRGKGK